MIWTGDNCLNLVPSHISQLMGLVLNPMTANAERGNLVAVAETREEILSFVEAEKVEPYTDGTWHKIFRKGGPLEWMNLPYGPLDGPPDRHWGHGIIKLELVPQWIRTA